MTLEYCFINILCKFHSFTWYFKSRLR